MEAACGSWYQQRASRLFHQVWAMAWLSAGPANLTPALRQHKEPHPNLMTKANGLPTS